MTEEKRPGHCMCDACICCYDACDCQDFVFCCAGSCDFVCIRHAGCCAAGYDCLGCGLVTSASRNEWCKIACFCCELGIVNPLTLCSYAEQCCCCQCVGSLPFHMDYVNAPVCATCGIQCCPKCGCCAAPPVAPIFKILRNSKTNEEMERE